MGRLVSIYLRPSSRTPARAVRTARAVAGHGLEGDHAGGGKRQVTVLAREAWEAACAACGAESLDPGTRRANLLVEGLELEQSRGRTLRVGAVRVLVQGETRPCQLMDDAHPGLRDALAPAWRGGVYGQLLDDGPLAVGDEARLEV